jgi:hypothetical protein
MVKPSDALLVSAMQRSSVATFARTAFVNNGQRNIVNVVDKYTSPYGELNLVMNRFQLASTALIFDPSYWKLCPLRNWFRQTLAKVGDSTQVEILGEFGHKHKNVQASGGILGLT